MVKYLLGRAILPGLQDSKNNSILYLNFQILIHIY